LRRDFGSLRVEVQDCTMENWLLAIAARRLTRKRAAAFGRRAL